MVDESGRLDHTRAAFALNKTMKSVDIPFDQRVLYTSQCLGLVDPRSLSRFAWLVLAVYNCSQTLLSFISRVVRSASIYMVA